MLTSTNKLESHKIVIIAGEESGDQHAAIVIKQLQARHPQIHITGIGGIHMQNAGAQLLCSLAQYGITGLSGVLRHMPIIRNAFRAIQAHLTATKPDLLILVDYPGFNLRLAKWAKKNLKIKILYYISPQIWAWKAQRMKTIRACVDHMAVILPFEKILYERAKVPVSFVNHPLVDQVAAYLQAPLSRLTLGLPAQHPLLCILPGSRIHEIKHHMPVLLTTITRLQKQIPKLHVTIPLAKTIPKHVLYNYLRHTKVPYTIIDGQAMATMACSDAIIVASGTASLECALLGKPMCIIYKVSTLTSMVAAKVIRVRYLGLCNLLQNKMIVPELIQYDCNPQELTRVAYNLLTNHTIRHNIAANLQQLRISLSAQQADCSLYTIIERELRLDLAATVRESSPAAVSTP